MGDNLEKFFNKQLSEDVPKDDWNTPSPDIWGNALAEINKKKPRNRSIIFLWIANGILLAGLLYALIYISLLKDKTTNIESNHRELIGNYKSKLNEPSSKSNPIYDKNNTLDTNTSHDKNLHSKTSIKSNDQTILNNTLKNNIKQFSNNKTLNQNSNSNSNINKDKSKNISNSDIKASLLKKKSEKILNDSKLSDSINKLIAEKEKQTINIKYLPGIDLIPLFCQKEVLNVSNLIKDINVFDKKNNIKYNNIIGLYFGPTLTAAPISGEIPADYSTLVGSSDLLISYEFGAEYSRRLFDNLYLKTGLSFRRIKFWSKAEISDSYDKSTEIINENGDVENIQNFGIPSALGYINTDLILTHPLSMQLEQGDQIDATVHLTQHLYFLRIPIGVEYYFPINNRLKLKSGIGLSFNKIVGYENLFDPIISHNGNEMGYVDLKSASMDVSNSFNYHFSLGATHTVNEKFHIFIDTQYFRNLKNIYETGKMKTKIHGFSLKIGGNYNF